MTAWALPEQHPIPANHPIPDPAPPRNYYAADRHLQRALARYHRHDPAALAWAEHYLYEWGGVCAQQVAPLYEAAERNPPTLKTYDRRGERVDDITFHPAYHEIERLAYGAGIASMCNRPGFRGLPGPAAQLDKFAAMYLFQQAEGSVGCPLSMTDILARVLNKYASPDLIARYVPRLTRLDDQQYTGAMFLTERAGGSDLGATITTARRDGAAWRLDGDKWFCSNVGADLILTLARPEGAPPGTRGLGLFLVPRLLSDGGRNPYLIHRLKDKLGTRAMASGEVTFTGTMAYLIEPLERGFVMMMEMVNGTRLHSGVAGAGALRRAVVEATLHARERHAFGRALAEQPLVAETLADLIADSAAATSLMLATAHALDRADRPEAARDEAVLSRLLIALLKRYATARGVQGAQAAMELRGGNGYIEDWPNARLLRDAEVQVIWEGGVNMVSFDVLRAVEREDAWPVYAGAVERELALAAAPDTALLADALHRALDRLNRLGERIGGWSREAKEIAAPGLAETMAALYAAALLAAEASFAFERSDDEGALALAATRRYHDRVLGPGLDALARHANADPRSAADTANLIAAAVVR